jgi:transaldolase
MRLFVDTASLADIEEWAAHPWISGVTTNPTLMRQHDASFNAVYEGEAMGWAKRAVEAAAGKPISIDGPEEVWELGPNVYRKVPGWLPIHAEKPGRPTNITAICTPYPDTEVPWYGTNNIVSVFAGRIMDTGRDPRPVIDAAKATGAQVLWASVREPYNIVQAEEYGCDIVTVPPAILRKWLDWHGKPLEVVAKETIAQFDKDREGLWT